MPKIRSIKFQFYRQAYNYNFWLVTDQDFNQHRNGRTHFGSEYLELNCNLSFYRSTIAGLMCYKILPCDRKYHVLKGNARHKLPERIVFLTEVRYQKCN